MKRKILFLSVLMAINLKTDSLITDEKQAEKYIKFVNERMAFENRKLQDAHWSYETDINDETTNAKILATKVYNDIQKKQSIEIKKYDWSQFSDYNRRQFEKYAVIGTATLVGKDEELFQNVSTNLETIYSTAKVCVKNKCGLPLEPDLEKIMSESTDYDELLETWIKWRDATGKKMRNDYITYYTLGNKAAKLNKLPNKEFKTMDELSLFDYETPDIKEQTEKLLNDLMPFYQKIHTYVRMNLEKKYPGKMPKDGTIPAHLLGNMWAQQWESLLNTIDGLEPYPELPKIDVTNVLKEKKYTRKKLFEMSDKFFVDLGLDPMTDDFWKKSVFVKPKDKEIVCHASAWEFSDKTDFRFVSTEYYLNFNDTLIYILRIKMCTNIDMDNMITIHHEMGHIQYYMQYKDQPTIYREGANPGFHEAIGDLLALSVVTPKHLKKLGLLNLDEKSNQIDKINLNFQLKMALEKVAILPYAYLMDKWRWDLFSGKVSSKEMNSHWWKLRHQLQGLSPPVKRTELDLDPGAKYHTTSGEDYIRYFVADILQFQFHKKLCSFGQKNEPFHKCDIDGDRNAGQLLKSMLKKGLSESWTKQLKDMIGTDKMDVKPMLEYFKPLDEFLDKQIKGQRKGWNSTGIYRSLKKATRRRG